MSHGSCFMKSKCVFFIKIPRMFYFRLFWREKGTGVTVSTRIPIILLCATHTVAEKLMMLTCGSVLFFPVSGVEDGKKVTDGRETMCRHCRSGTDTHRQHFVAQSGTFSRCSKHMSCSLFQRLSLTFSFFFLNIAMNIVPWTCHQGFILSYPPYLILLRQWTNQTHLFNWSWKSWPCELETLCAAVWARRSNTVWKKTGRGGSGLNETR